MNDKIQLLNCQEYEEGLKISKSKNSHHREEKARRKTCRCYVEDDYFNLYAATHRDSTISALTMEDTKTFQEMYDKFRKIDISKLLSRNGNRFMSCI
jgi:hypothetical protein